MQPHNEEENVVLTEDSEVLFNPEHETEVLKDQEEVVVDENPNGDIIEDGELTVEETPTEDETVEEAVDNVDEEVAVPTATYKITAEYVDHFDEQNNIIGTFGVDEVVELTVEYGDKLVEDGRAEKVEA